MIHRKTLKLRGIEDVPELVPYISYEALNFDENLCKTRLSDKIEMLSGKVRNSSRLGPSCCIKLLSY
jgi:hypothetical protein